MTGCAQPWQVRPCRGGRRCCRITRPCAPWVATDGRSPFRCWRRKPGALAEGLLLAPDATQRARLDAYEALFDYRPEAFEVLCGGVAVPALIYRAGPNGWQGGPAWDIDSWARDWAALRMGAAAEVMALWPDLCPALMAQRYPMIERAVDARLRAAKQPAPARLRRAAQPEDVASARTRRPYARFFGVQEDDLQFRAFNGGQSEQVTRAGFVMGDAVTLLPYDPARDLVLLVEQFRYGAWLRGDPNPWSLEPIAGRIDPGETPEQAARREAMEEARLTLGALHPIGGHYPSPAAVTEYLYAFIGLTDLGPQHEGVAGLASEAEDIRAHVLPFARLMRLIAQGEVQNGPLLLSAWWLAAHRGSESGLLGTNKGA